MPKSYRSKGGWLWKRLQKLPAIAATGEVRDVLGVNQVQLLRWTEHKDFQKALVASRDNYGFWEWDKERLILWMIATWRLKPSRYMCKKGTEPWCITREEAQERLGL